MAYHSTYHTTVLAVKIDKSLKKGFSSIQAASGNWTLNQQRASIVDTILAVNQGVVIDVFDVVGPPILVPNVVNSTNPNMSKTRIKFNLRASSPQRQALYKNKQLKFRSVVKYI